MSEVSELGPTGAMPDETMRAAWHQFIAWAGSKGYDTAHTYDTDRSRWVALNPMTADLWGAWQASRASDAPAGDVCGGCAGSGCDRCHGSGLAGAAPGGEPGDSGGSYAWRCTGGGLVRFMSDAKYRRQHPGVQRWYVPICSRCGPPSEASQRALLQQALEALEFSRRYPGLQQASDEELIAALRAAISESEGSSNADRP